MTLDDVVSGFLENPAQAFRAALDEQDPVALALAGVLDPDIEGPRVA